MTDRRRFWAEASEAEIAKVCRLNGLRRVEPCIERIATPVADLCAAPYAARDRQMLRGHGFAIHAVDDESGWAFGETLTDGYSGWVDTSDLFTIPATAPTHRLVAQSYGKTNTGLKTAGFVTPLSLGSTLVVLDETDGWARVAYTNETPRSELFVPLQHLAPIDQTESDPVTVAERLLGTPYLWGGNSSFGIDCSGLVQIACHACGIDCPGDSDMQQAHFPAASDATYQRGDLMFWPGHVAWVSDPQTLIHANAHHMAVAREPITSAIARISAAGDGPPTRHARLTG